MIAKPTINNTAMTTANTEYSYAFPGGTKAFSIKLESLNALLKIAFVSVTIPRHKNISLAPI